MTEGPAGDDRRPPHDPPLVGRDGAVAQRLTPEEEVRLVRTLEGMAARLRTTLDAMDVLLGSVRPPADDPGGRDADR